MLLLESCINILQFCMASYIICSFFSRLKIHKPAHIRWYCYVAHHNTIVFTHVYALYTHICGYVYNFPSQSNNNFSLTKFWIEPHPFFNALLRAINSCIQTQYVVIVSVILLKASMSKIINFQIDIQFKAYK